MQHLCSPCVCVEGSGLESEKEIEEKVRFTSRGRHTSRIKVKPKNTQKKLEECFFSVHGGVCLPGSWLMESGFANSVSR